MSSPSTLDLYQPFEGWYSPYVLYYMPFRQHSSVFFSISTYLTNLHSQTILSVVCLCVACACCRYPATCPADVLLCSPYFFKDYVTTVSGRPRAVTGIYLLLQMVASALMAHSIQAPALASSSSRPTVCSNSAPLILQTASFRVALLTGDLIVALVSFIIPERETFVVECIPVILCQPVHV